ncbi:MULTISPECIES: HTH-type transcriptional activator RhaS [Brenneria]|uniref:HTH-type transcriptional activator RhaS n=1 Tax=Brenneria nigrifluens DSM 30175 = ATCC 13028 TaxID=1121120 RepID=A0A2U1UR43_9GAMM|nr:MULTISPECIES: HTH-type transcriptional activator RhaS [Brenneria]EHD22305.1 transcriptional regulator, AraC family [Brenneria sp. EniD312]PWC24130.1 HTH-type transcriptional activator RhaS [Brenneria nigrifluens DSM 30175 = ATCC 13028]QCR05322.1 HTH-type transcriptional activator RhaS [Brenneria nigrifluens DSM 30175 = ATCC 13028]
MTLLYADDFFISKDATITIEPRIPQAAFPEHCHDFWEIVLVEKGSGTHVFNDQPYILNSGTVCFIRADDHHLFENVDELIMTNVLYRSPLGFRFLTDISRFLPSHTLPESQVNWQINHADMQRAKQFIQSLAGLSADTSPEGIAASEGLFLQLLIMLSRCRFQNQGQGGREQRLQDLLRWLQHNFCNDINWVSLAEQFQLPLRTLHRQLKQQTGMTPQRYLNRLRLLEARKRLLTSDQTITEIAHACGFGDSNHFSTQFRREFFKSPKMLRNNEH